MAALDEPVLHRGRDQAPDRAGHGEERQGVQITRREREPGESVLECRVEVEAEQNLRAQDEKARLIERRLDLSSEGAATHYL
jgi:hypothetical protein